MTMSRAMYAAGAVEIAAGALMILSTDNPTWVLVGVVIGGLGGLAIGVGFALGEMTDPVEREVDEWERNWGARWTPVCPVHGAALCPIRTHECPSVREREDV